MRTRAAQWLILSCLLLVGSSALLAPAAAQDLEFEQVGDQPIDGQDLDFDQSGALWAGSIALWRLPSGSNVWEEIYDEPGSIGDQLLVISPDTVFLSSISAVARSVDGGQTFFGVHWEGNKLYGAPLEGPNSGVILAGEATGGSGIAYSTDRGATFTEATFTVSTNTRPQLETAVEIPDGPAAGRLVAGVFAGVVISEDGGQAWEPSSLFQDARFWARDMDIGVNPLTGERRLYLALVDAQMSGGQLYISDDDGLTWTHSYTFPWTLFLATIPPPPDGDGSLLAMTGADGVMFRSEDGGETFEEVGQVPFPFAGHAANDMLIGPDNRLYVAVSRTGPERAWVYRTTEPVVVSNEPPPEIPDEESSLRVYPNPTTDFITVETDTDEIEILDVLGRVVLRAEPNAQIDISNLPAGVYVVRAGSLSQRFTVVR